MADPYTYGNVREMLLWLQIPYKADFVKSEILKCHKFDIGGRVIKKAMLKLNTV